MRNQSTAYLAGFLQSIIWLSLSALILFTPEQVSFFSASTSPHHLLVGVFLLLLGIQTFHVVSGNKQGRLWQFTAFLNLLAGGWAALAYMQAGWFFPAVLMLAYVILFAGAPPAQKYSRAVTQVFGVGILVASGLRLYFAGPDLTAFFLLGSGAILFWQTFTRHSRPYLWQTGIWAGWLYLQRPPWSHAADLWLLPALLAIFLLFEQRTHWTSYIWQAPVQPAPLQMALSLSWASSVLFLVNISSPTFINTLSYQKILGWLLALTLLLHFVLMYAILSINFFINQLVHTLEIFPEDVSLTPPPQPNLPFWLRWLPLVQSNLQRQQTLLAEQQQQIARLSQRLQRKEQHIDQLYRLQSLEDTLRPVLDKPVTAQLVVNHLQKILSCDLAAVLIYLPQKENLQTLAVATRAHHILPPRYEQSIHEGLIGRAIRQKKPIYTPDTRLETEYTAPYQDEMRSEIITPLIHQGYLNGILLVAGQKANAFDPKTLIIVERAARLLLHSWEQSDVEQRKRLLLRQRVLFSRLLRMDQVLTEAARTARKALKARFVYVGLFDQWGQMETTAHSGLAIQLPRSLRRNPHLQDLISQIDSQGHILHIRDVRHTPFGRHLVLDSEKQRDLLVIPLRLQEQIVGVIMAFGKENGITFSTADREIAHLLSIQVSAAVENTWLYEEVRTNLSTINRLYKLSLALTTSTSLGYAAEAILKTAYEITQAQSGGIALYDTDHNTTIRKTIATPNIPPPSAAELRQNLDNLLVMDFAETSRIFLPLRTAQRLYGIVWLDVNTTDWEKARSTTSLQMLRNQAALALERQLLLAHTQEQAQQLATALKMLEEAYDQTLIALTNALDARDRETEGHSVRVSQLARLLGQRLGLSAQALKSLERGALLHDIGKIGISDTILHKPGPLTPDEWEIMRQHPDIGARIVSHIPFLQDTIEVIRYHQERWNGNGYPLGLKGEEIPLKARIFAVADALDALTSDRPYRRKSSLDEAVDYIRQQAGKEFDPQVVAILLQLYQEGRLKSFLQ